MSRTAADYQQLLMALLPSGDIWPREGESTLGLLLLALAEEMARVDARLADVLDEADPRTAWEMLLDWETALGLPDECYDDADTMAQRREAVIRKLTKRGSQSRAFYIALAAEQGYEIEIEEFGVFRAGDPAGSPCNGEDWAYAWKVWAPETTVRRFLAGSGAAGEPLATWGNEKLECIIANQAPAHTVVMFGYEIAEE